MAVVVLVLLPAYFNTSFEEKKNCMISPEYNQHIYYHKYISHSTCWIF